MTSAMLAELLKSLGVLGIFLLIGFFLRAKLNIFQKTFLPSSIIGGFILLILGPIGLNIIKIPQEWLKMWALIPGIVIVPVVTATPLGLKIQKTKGTTSNTIGTLIFIMFIVYYAQCLLGFLINLVFKKSLNLYDSFGWELAVGYSGGHGTAGILGNMLQEANLPYWETAQGVAVTMATFGIVGGILIGMVLINYAARKGYTAKLSTKSGIDRATAIGYERDIEKQKSLGKETTISASLDTLAFHSAVIFGACYLAYTLLDLFKKYKVPGLSAISVWAYGIIVMFIIWKIIQKLKLDFLIDNSVKGKITSSFTEFAVIAAIASLPIKAVLTYLVPILIMAVLGYILTIAVLFFLCKKFLKNDWFETMIATFGMSTGVFLTGLLLLKICDPEFETTALGNYSIGFSILSAISFAMFPLFLNTIVLKGTMGAFLLSCGLVGIGFVGLLIMVIFGKKLNS